MKRYILIAAATFAILSLLSKSGVLSALMMFVLVGAIPGTTVSLPAGLMLTLCGAVALLITLRFTAISAIETLSLHRLTRKHIAYRERMPKRRFQSVTHPQA